MAGTFIIGHNIGKGISGVVKRDLGFLYNFGLGMLGGNSKDWAHFFCSFSGLNVGCHCF